MAKANWIGMEPSEFERRVELVRRANAKLRRSDTLRRVARKCTERNPVRSRRLLAFAEKLRWSAHKHMLGFE